MGVEVAVVFAKEVLVGTPLVLAQRDARGRPLLQSRCSLVTSW
jgi:hypothetical protein